MSKQQWAGIVYGRSYYLDFRLIANPKDFSRQQIDWALEHIIPTTRAPNKLSNHPRWSLFKNEFHCMIGVTCMVRDLIGHSSQDATDNLTKDAQGRPLYIFVGYGTQFNSKERLLDYPPYSGNDLAIFRPLYQHVKECWQVRHYDTNGKKTILTDYQEVFWAKKQLKTYFNSEIARRLNSQGKHPAQTFIWEDSEQWRRKLWKTTAGFQQPISLCLGCTHKRDLIKSPFLNATAQDTSEFTIQERIDNNKGNNPISRFISKKEIPRTSEKPRSLPKLLENKVKEDIQLTIQHTEQAVEKGQEFVQNLMHLNTSTESETKTPQPEITETKNFGFKTKSSSDSSNWF
jgi:hypothetical protein